jgi:hypothetical protein
MITEDLDSVTIKKISAFTRAAASVKILSETFGRSSRVSVENEVLAYFPDRNVFVFNHGVGSIHGAADYATAIADETGASVAFRFNSRDILVRPGEEAEDVVVRYTHSDTSRTATALIGEASL